MRYKKIQVTYCTVVDEKIEELEQKLSLLKQLVSCHEDFKIIYKVDNYNSNIIVTHNKVRIKHINENSIDILVITSSGSFWVRNINVNDIIEIEFITESNNVVIGKTEVNRFDLIDFSGESLNNENKK